MKANQQLTYKGVEVALYPMEVINITQGRNGQYSHQGIDAYDLAGKDGGIDLLYAPFSLRVVWKDSRQATGVVVENIKEVLMANGEIIAPRCLCMMVWHKDDISGLNVGDTFQQGQPFYAEGTKGWATGNHVHLELTRWRYDGSYPLFKAPSGRWTLKGEGVNIEKCFFLNDTVVKYAMYNFNYFKQTEPQAQPIQDDGKVYTVNATNGLNLRKQPTTNSDVLTVIPHATKLKGVIQGDWLLTEYNGNRGYCFTKFINGINRGKRIKRTADIERFIFESIFQPKEEADGYIFSFKLPKEYIEEV